MKRIKVGNTIWTQSPLDADVYARRGWTPIKVMYEKELLAMGGKFIEDEPEKTTVFVTCKCGKQRKKIEVGQEEQVLDFCDCLKSEEIEELPALFHPAGETATSTEIILKNKINEIIRYIQKEKK